MKIAVGLALAALAGPALAQEMHVHPYLGLSLGQSTLKDWDADVIQDGSVSGASADNGDTSTRALFGLEVSRYASVELGYTDLGKATVSGYSDGSGPVWSGGQVRAAVTATGYDLSVLGQLPVATTFSLLGRLGLFQWDEDITAADSTGPASASDSGTDLLFGVGGQFSPIPRWKFRAEYTRYTLDDDKVDTLGLTAAAVLGHLER